MNIDPFTLFHLLLSMKAKALHLSPRDEQLSMRTLVRCATPVAIAMRQCDVRKCIAPKKDEQTTPELSGEREVEFESLCVDTIEETVVEEGEQ